MRPFLILACLVFISCGSAATPCDRCDDGRFCNGAERCSGGGCLPGIPPACNDSVACTIDTCAEEARTCVHTAPDIDGDGHTSANCLDGSGAALGDDCDDADPNRFPGNDEVCDGSHDEDCDVETYGFLDRDEDGYGDPACCNTVSSGGQICGKDCDDFNYAIQPGTMKCTANPATILICQPGGMDERPCGGQLVCVPQPNGTGICG